jgi:hypothetical protein
VEVVFTIIAGLIIILITFAVSSSKERQLDDANDDSVVYLDKLEEVSTLQDGGKYLVRVLRQSGNLQKDDQIFDCRFKAIKTAITTLKRAKIDFVLISKNTEVEFFFRRTYHHHGGSAEGKKIGSVEIYKVE